MRNIYYFGLLCYVFVVACNSTPKEELKPASNHTATPFSDTLKLDTFKVSLEGTDPKNSSLQFSIISYKGKEIYKVNIQGADLLKANQNLKTNSEKMKYLNNQVQFFFEEEHFIWPAVMPTEKADENVPDKAFYEELKQTQLNGFNYRLGKEAKVYIAWSEKDQKVKVFYQTHDTF
ncbi:hypothetical protein [Pedobacter insulae]|uniref:Lipoprotein n=1 Tax=Pedobacter insulae TaxID=414048 RepID=A0A1I3AEC2_9SPHI|nr:hypothetical protein [Pedobacter insulae]SFH48414.1 hypothetical protein SAMN04489864_11444 [Pedobacter insulae]